MKRKNRYGFALTTLLATSVAAGEARAQSLRPHVMFIFDTSTSMLDNSSGNEVGEGTNICGTNSTTSRLYGLKSGLRAALAQAGTDEAVFGLMSFPQVVVANPNTSNWCGSGTPPLTGHYRATPTRDAIATPNRTSSSYHDADGYPYGCLLTTNSTETAYGNWFSSAAGEVMRVGVTTAAAGVVPTAAQYDPPDGNIAAIYRWIDNVELPTTSAAVTNPELHGTGYTPLGRSLFYARMYFDNLVKPVDPKGSCRQNVVFLVTDGAETCYWVTAPNNSFNLTDCTGGGNYNPFNPVAQACRLFRTSGIRVFVITDTTTGAANDTIAAAGGTTTAVRVSLSDPNAAETAIVRIIAETVPPPEICNGVDDNCNMLIDEGVSNMCPFNATTLRHCAVESCNCVDDDCDGTVDEGFPANACGQPCGCAIPTELCDGLDNDCDGDIDEGYMVGASCFNTGIGACRRGGILVCRADGMGTVCDAPTVGPQPEVCNNIDDNCNGQVDEGGSLPGVGEPCGNGLGTCQSGTFVCTNGRLTCNATGVAIPEICDGLDNNCDNVIDNGTFPETGQTCICPGLDPAKVGVGICRAGRLICRGTAKFVCEGCTLPGTEVCDMIDNDCDGMIDTNSQCPSGFGCRDGQCTIQCVGGEFSCPAGYKCVGDFCVPQRCANVTCPSGQRCQESDGTCVDLCSGITCNAPKSCVQGRCLDCNDPLLACTAPQICVAGVCQTDRCLGRTCPVGSYCSDGNCIDLCVPGKCAAGQRCVAGECIPDTCATVPCGIPGQFCNPATGLCEVDRCPSVTCGAGMTCVPSTRACIPDPCRTIECPGDCWYCSVTSDGHGTCLLDTNKCKQVETKVGQRGGGEAGCGCAVGAGDRPGDRLGLGLLLAFGLATVVGRRRGTSRRS